MATRLWNRWFRSSGPGEEAEQALALRAFADELEAELREVDYEEVTLEDRMTLVEHVAVWQVRCALARGQFDLALGLQRLAVRRISELRAAEDSLSRGEEGDVRVELDRPQRVGPARLKLVVEEEHWPDEEVDRRSEVDIDSAAGRAHHVPPTLDVPGQLKLVDRRDVDSL